MRTEHAPPTPHYFRGYCRSVRLVEMPTELRECAHLACTIACLNASATDASRIHPRVLGTVGESPYLGNNCWSFYMATCASSSVLPRFGSHVSAMPAVAMQVINANGRWARRLVLAEILCIHAPRRVRSRSLWHGRSWSHVQSHTLLRLPNISQ